MDKWKTLRLLNAPRIVLIFSYYDYAPKIATILRPFMLCHTLVLQSLTNTCNAFCLTSTHNVFCKTITHNC